MTDQPKKPSIPPYSNTTQLDRGAPPLPPILTESWVIWESAAVIQTNGIKLDTGTLHDLLKKELDAQKVPIDIFYSPNACWIIEGAMGERKIDKDRRPRVVATLRGSIYTNMQFITGIDYFGVDSDWVDIQMMMIVQPEKPEDPGSKPMRPREISNTPLIPNEAIWSLAALSLILISYSLVPPGNSGLWVLGLAGAFGALWLGIKSNKNVVDAMKINTQNQIEYEQKLAQWQNKVEKIKLEEEELKKNRLSRSFQWDDLRVMHSVMTRSIAKIVHEQLIERGAKIKESVQSTKNEEIIPESKKNLFDEF